jgi:RND family efflux transporter MFP subunit
MFEPGQRTTYGLRICANGLLIAIGLSFGACDQKSSTRPDPPTQVRAQVVTLTPRAASVSLTGEIRARVQSDLSFRLAGRIASRNVEVGDHVEAGQVLATLETNEQTADVNAASAGVQAAEATLRQAMAVFERQETLMVSGHTTRTNYDNAKQASVAAQAALDSAKANLANAEEQLANTALRSNESGVVTARSAEAGQVVEAAQSVFTIANDGGRDAVFDVYEVLLVKPPADRSIELILLSNPSVKAVGTVREIAPTIDPSTGTVRVKIGIDSPPPEMGLGAPVAGIARFQSRDVVALPWTAFFTQNGEPAVWTVEPQSKRVFVKPVVIDSYRSGEFLLRDGVKPGDIVVTAGAQLLRPGEIVAPQMTAAPAAGVRSEAGR